MKVFGGVHTVPAAPHPFTCGICYKVQVNLWGLIHQQGTELDRDIHLWVSGCKNAKGEPSCWRPWSPTDRASRSRRAFRRRKIGAASCWIQCAAPWRTSPSPCCPAADSSKFLSTQQLREHRELRIWALTHKATSLTNTRGARKVLAAA